MGINLGAALGAIIAGYLGQTWGWSCGFGAAGFCMLLALVVFVCGQPWLLGRGEPPDPARLAAPVSGIRLEWWLYILSILSIGVSLLRVQTQAVSGSLLGISGPLLVITVLASAVSTLPPLSVERFFFANI